MAAETSSPEYMGNENTSKYINLIKKEFGDYVAKQVDDGLEKMHWGRDNQDHGHDKLASRQWSSKFKGGPRVTAAGKMNKQDVSALKNRIKSDKRAWGGVAKKANLPEEAEQIDELKKSTLGSYIKKANVDAMKHAQKSGEYNNPDQPKHFSKAMDRMRGVKKATDKLVAKEEVEELDELKKSTLGSYVKKAAGSMAGKTAVAAAQASSSMGKSSPDIKRGIVNRMKGITRATDRLTKEEVEQIDEISKSTLGSYATKALRRGDIAARMSHSDSDEMGKIANKRLTGAKQAVDKLAPKGAATRIKTSIDKAREAARNRGTEKDDEGKAYYSAQKGIAKVREEVEQIDELKRSTLASYVKKASTDQYLKGQAVQYHTNKAQTADGVFAKQSKEKHYDAADKALKKASNRDTGIQRAADKLAKEEVEINEAFGAGSLKLNDGSSVSVKPQDAKLLNQLMDGLKPENAKKMLKVAMTDKHGFNEILGFAREAL